MPSDYRETLIELYGNFVRPRRASSTTTQQAAQERLQEARLAAEVEVAERYGRWDTEQGNVVPPEGPVSPTTVPLIAPVGG